MNKLQWTMVTLSGIIIVVSVNVWAAKRDIKLFQELERLEQIEKQQEPVYKQLPVIPFTNEQ